MRPKDGPSGGKKIRRGFSSIQEEKSAQISWEQLNERDSIKSQGADSWNRGLINRDLAKRRKEGNCYLGKRNSEQESGGALDAKTHSKEISKRGGREAELNTTRETAR